MIQLDALLFWEVIDSLPDPMVQLPLPHATADQLATSLVIVTANVLTFYPREAQGETWAPSARRVDLAKQIREVGVDILDVQEGRSRKDHFVVCEGYAMWISAATPGGSGGTELWISTSVCDHTGAIVSIRDPSRLVAHSPPRAEERWESTGAILRRIPRPVRDRIVMIDANGRLGEAPTPLQRNSYQLDFDDNGSSLLDFMHHWDMEAPAFFKEHDTGLARPCPVELNYPTCRTCTSGPGGSPACGHPGCFSAQACCRCRTFHLLLARCSTTGYRPSLQRAMPPLLSTSSPS